MERFKSITIIFLLLAVGLLASAAQAKPASVLLQEGLYAEQIEGDLDAAIKIYEKIIAQAEQTQQSAARAMYRIGICRLKKGDKTQAAQEFQQLIGKFPGQKPLVAKAQQQLAKLEPATAGVFGPIIEKVINDDGVGEDFMFDLDIGKSFSASDAKEWTETSDIGQGKSLEDFVMKSGVDLFGETSKKSLMGIDMIAMPVHNEQWNMSPGDVIEQLFMGKPGTPIALSADGQLPKTFVFKTGEGGMGILQITKMQAGKAPRHFKIRYKMVIPSVPVAQLAKKLTRKILPECDTTTFDLLDLPSGDLINSEPGGDMIDLKNSKGMGHLYFDRAYGEPYIVGIRGTRLQRRRSGKLVPTEPERVSRGIAAYYAIASLPCQYRVTMGTGEKYELKITSIEQGHRGGCQLEYWKESADGGAVAPTVPIFDSPQTATVYDIDHPKTMGKHCTIDLDTGTTAGIPATMRSRGNDDVMSYLAGEGVDAVGEFAGKEAGLIAFGMVVEVMPAQAWDRLTPAELTARLSERKIAATETKIVPWNDQGDRAVFAFATREGAMGLLQILSADEKAQRFELRYKKLKTHVGLEDAESNAMDASPGAAADLLPALKGLMGGVFNAIENNDTDTAVLLLDKLIADSKKLAQSLKGTSAEAGVTSGIGTLEMLREALANKQMDRAKSLLSAINQMGPGLEDAVEKEAAKPRPEMTPAQEQPDKG
ncbi:MAG: tetratricopeptide repeat protein [Planctomycetes bacterium]|nr:tetratricopeptide repeat protein [Planctomycetota bacterium]